MTGTMIIDGRELVPIGTGHARNAYMCIAHEVTYRLVPTHAGTGHRLRRSSDAWCQDFPTLAEAVAHIMTLDIPPTRPPACEGACAEGRA